MPFKFVDHATIDRMLDMYDSGTSAAETGKAFGVNAYTVYNWLRRKGRKTRNPTTTTTPAFSEEEVKGMVELYRQGASASSIAKIYGTYPSLVLGVARSHGCATRKPGRTAGSGVVDKMTPEEYALHLSKQHPGIVELIQEGKMTLQAIGDKYGLTRERVRQYERTLQLPERMKMKQEAAALKNKLRELNSQKIKSDRKRKWINLANHISGLILSGASTEELIEAVPWKFGDGKVPKNMRLAMMISRLRTLSGVNIPYRGNRRNLPHS